VTDRDELRESMWWCSECEAWLGWKVDVCFECGTPRPDGALRTVDVDDPDRYYSRADEPRERFRRAWYRALGMLGRRP